MSEQLLNGPIEEKCREKLKTYLAKAEEQEISVLSIAKGSDVHSQTLLRFAYGEEDKDGNKPSLRLSKWDGINKYMNENPL